MSLFSHHPIGVSWTVLDNDVEKRKNQIWFLASMKQVLRKIKLDSD